MKQNNTAPTTICLGDNIDVDVILLINPNLMALIQIRMIDTEHPPKCSAVLYRWSYFHELSKEVGRSWEIVRCLF